MVTYVTTDPSSRWVGTGSPILPAQVDENFYELRDAIDNISLQTPVSIASITASGTTMEIELTDNTISSVQMPVPIYTARGEWAADTLYEIADTFYYGLSAYFVNVQHTSASPFNANATDGGGRFLYTLIITIPGLPAGGATGAVLTKNSATDQDASWVKEPGVSAVQNVSGALTLDRATGKVKRLNVTGNVTSMTLSNFGVSGEMQEMVLEIVNATGATVAWPTGTKWAGGTPPTLSTGTDLIRLTKLDATSLIYGVVIGSDFS